MLFEHYTEPNDFIAEVLSEKVALKLMAECANSFETLIGNFHIKFGKLQILGYHNKGAAVRTSTQKLEPLFRESRVDFNLNVTPISGRKATGNIDVTNSDGVKDVANRTMPCLSLQVIERVTSAELTSQTGLTEANICPHEIKEEDE